MKKEKVKEILKILYPNAKLNLNLFIGEKEKTWWDDYYHKILSIMVPIDLYDRIIIERGKFEVKYKFMDINNINMKNISGKSYEYLKNMELQKTRYDDNKTIEIENCIIRKVLKILDINEEKLNYKITIEKNIPLASGLGGASSDAAFFVKFLIEENIVKFKSEKEIFKKLCQIGSDVPFFYVNKPSIVSGFGEKVFPLNMIFNLYFVIIQPFSKISTKIMYEELDNYSNRKILHKIERKKNIKRYKKNLQNKKNYAFYLREIAGNDFESVITNRIYSYHEVTKDFKKSLFAQITGAGSSIFGVFQDFKDAKECYDYLKNIHGRVYICSCKT
ncbi:MAG: 4-(cytidine 5'-diphospho)-2-C-methyl-D-erythritol kinase [Exilispira sp.]